MNVLRALVVSVGAVTCVPFASATEVFLAANRDATIYAASGDTANGAGEHLYAGFDYDELTRALIRFDVAAAVPAGATITHVELILHMSETFAPPRWVYLHRVLADWSEGTSVPSGNEIFGGPASANDVTWTSRRHPGSPWATLGGDFEPVASAGIPIVSPDVYTWTSATLVADAQAMLDAPGTNHGWMLRNQWEDTTTSAMRFDSRQHAEPVTHPKLRVVYDVPCSASATSYCVAAPNSTGAGATIGWSGSLSVVANAFTLTCTQLPPNASLLFYFGTQTTQAAFGNGYRCVGGSLARLNPPATANASGTVSRFVDLTAARALGNITPGSTRYFQCWYRNVAAGGAGFNLSNGLSATFCN